MKLEPQSENGKRLHTIMVEWINRSPEIAMDKLKRMFLTFSLNVKNEDGFVAVLYGQNVLDNSPLNLCQHVPTALLRVQLGMESSMDKRCVKELVVALEWSKNESVLTDILTYVEKNWMEIMECIQKGHSTDLAPRRVSNRRQLSEIPGETTMPPRHRRINSNDDKEPWCKVLEVYKEKIIIGWMNGQIQIYSSVDLLCQTVLNYARDDNQWTDRSAVVTCLQCTCTEIVAGYDDGNICFWNVAKGTLIRKFRLVHENGGDDEDYVTHMRRRGIKLVAGTMKGRVYIWQYVSSSEFTLVGSWDATEGALIRQLDFNENYVILQSHRKGSRSVHVKSLNDLQQCRSISGPGLIHYIAIDGNHLITSHGDNVLRIWDISTGTCLTEGLKGHEHDIRAVAVYAGVIASSDYSGQIIIWSMRAGLEGRQAKLASFKHPTFTGRYDWFHIQLGRNFLVRNSLDSDSRNVQVVTDFPL